MKTIITMTCLGLLIALSCSSISRAQESRSHALYQITSGRYVELGGWTAGWTNRLPMDYQKYVQLGFNFQNGTIEMAFLGTNMHPVFTTFAFTNGQLCGTNISFNYETCHPYHCLTNALVNYTVSLSEGTLRIQGCVTSTVVCCDVPWYFGHEEVVAELMPELKVRVNKGTVDLSWGTSTRKTYQLQYREQLETNGWLNAGSPVPGTGGSNSVSLPKSIREEFYRVLLIP